MHLIFGSSPLGITTTFLNNILLDDNLIFTFRLSCGDASNFPELIYLFLVLLFGE